ncbi:MAG: hypothetical protein N2376_15095 [Clostridia bacterium]|nr:hypothetical protein [Clostridia bacterium]
MAYQSKQESAFKKFIKENKSLAFMLPILAVLVIVLIIIYSGVFNKKAAPALASVTTSPSASANPSNSSNGGEPTGGQPQVEVLPQIVRSTSSSAVEVVKDPFETPMKLTGIVYSNDRSAAIVQCGGISYIVQSGQTIGDSSWEVTQIDKDTITIASNGKSLELELTDGATVSEGQ